MNRVTRRASALLLLVIALVGGLTFFIYEYFTKADQWIVSAGSPHIYNSSNIGCGQVVDRSGNLLLDITQTRTYADQLSVRKSTIHWLGDRQVGQTYLVWGTSAQRDVISEDSAHTPLGFLKRMAGERNKE